MNSSLPIFVFQLAVFFILPVFLIGTINRTKALWAGRVGQPLNQLYFDLVRLMGKTPVYSEASSWIFQIAPWIILSTTLMAALLVPLVPGYSLVSFDYDFICFVYLLGLGRIFLVLSALDTGSPFEGMGASREATFGAMMEPAFLVCLGGLALASGHTSFASLITDLPIGPWAWFAKFGLFVSLFILLQVEGARVPVDDPNTHLELTMIHEVMILDHSGPELALVQAASALKYTLIAGFISALLNPFSNQTHPVASMGFCLLGLFAVSILVGLVESLIARFKMSAIPRYTFVAFIAGLISLGIYAGGAH